VLLHADPAVVLVEGFGRHQHATPRQAGALQREQRVAERRGEERLAVGEEQVQVHVGPARGRCDHGGERLIRLNPGVELVEH
jgi:hypothetical protein